MTPKIPVYGVTQAELCINHLIPYGPNPNISAYEGLHGRQFDFRAHPIAPAGTKVLIHNKPTIRSSWAPHGVLGFYIGPAQQHYRCFEVWSLETQTMRITDTLAWLLDKLVLPNIGRIEVEHHTVYPPINGVANSLNRVANSLRGGANLNHIANKMIHVANF